MTKSVAILITTTEKRKDYFDRLLSSIEQQTFLPEKIFIIYDGILDEEKKKIYETYPLSLVWLDNQKKFPLTNLQNQAISTIGEDDVLLLNDDIVLDKDFIRRLFLVIEKDKNIGIACGKILRMDKCTLDSAGQLLAKNRKPLERGYGRLDKGQFDRQEYVFSACGAAVLYRKKMLDDIAITAGEYLDNDYNMFYEDLDVAWRARNSGWDTFYEPKAIAYHERGSTAKTKRPGFKSFRPYNFVWLKSHLKSDLIKNRYMTIIKNDRFPNFLFNIHHILFYELKLWIYCLFFDPRVILDTFKNFHFFRKAFKKRKLLLNKIKTEE